MEDFFAPYRKQLEAEGLLYLNIKVIPKAQKTQAVELMKGPEGEEIVKIKVAAVPEKGKANAELCRYLKRVFGTGRDAINRVCTVSVVQGQTSQRKVVRIET